MNKQTKTLNAAGAERQPRPLPPALAVHRWRPGQSGNPGGRTPEYAEVQRLCREASPIAARRLIELMGSPDERVALMAADKVLERAWGRPKDQPIDSEVERLRRMTPEERERDARELAQRVRAVLRSAGVAPRPENETQRGIERERP